MYLKQVLDELYQNTEPESIKNIVNKDGFPFLFFKFSHVVTLHL